MSRGDGPIGELVRTTATCKAEAVRVQDYEIAATCRDVHAQLVELLGEWKHLEVLKQEAVFTEERLIVIWYRIADCASLRPKFCRS